MKTAIRLFAATTLAAGLGVPAFAQTEVDIGALTCAQYAALDADSVVAVLDAFGGATLPDDEMADDGVPNNEIDPGAVLDDTTNEDGNVVENAMSEQDVAAAAMQANSGSDDLGATITIACEGMADMTVVEALKAYTN